MTTETNLDPKVIQQAAEQLRGAATGGKPVAPVRDLISAGGVDAAYAVQEINTRHYVDSGRRLVGRKIGLTSLSVQRQLRSEEHTSELQSLMRISYAVFCLKKKNYKQHTDQ